MTWSLAGTGYPSHSCMEPGKRGFVPPSFKRRPCTAARGPERRDAVPCISPAPLPQPPGSVLSPRGLAASGRGYGPPPGGRRCYWHLVREAAPHPTAPAAGPDTENHPVQSTNGVEGEKPSCSRLGTPRSWPGGDSLGPSLRSESHGAVRDPARPSWALQTAPWAPRGQRALHSGSTCSCWRRCSIKIVTA